MSSTLRAVQYRPSTYLPLGTITPINDWSGYGHDATSTGTPHLGVSLAHGVEYSTIVDDTNQITFDSDVFFQGIERQPFSLTAIVRTVKADQDNPYGPQQIIGNGTLANGLTVNGTVYTFAVEYEDDSVVSVSHDIQLPRRVHAIGVYTGEKIILYIDGELVNQSSISEEQKLLKFKSTDETLSCGAADGGDFLALNGIGVYPRALNVEEVERLYVSAYDPTDSDIWRTFGGIEYQVSQQPLSIFYQANISTAADWNSGTFDGAVVSGNVIVPNTEGIESLPSAWVGVFPFTMMEDNIYGVNIDWDGIGASVEVSLDLITWEAVYKGKNVESIPPDTDPLTVPALYVRVYFEGYVENDLSYVSSITLTGFKESAIADSASSKPLNDREVRYTGAPLDIRQEWPCQLLHENWGAKTFDSGGKILVVDNSEADDAPFVPKTIEVWVKLNDLSGVTSSSNLSTATAVYNNGVDYTGFNVDEWAIIYYVNASGFSGDVWFSGPIQIGRIVYYPTAMTKPQTKLILAAYFGIDILTVDADNDIDITQPTDSALLTSHDWTMFTTTTS